MCALKVVALSALALFIALVSVNGQDKDDKKCGKEIIEALCIPCPEANATLQAFKTCMSGAGFTDAVAAATGTGKACVDGLEAKKDQLATKGDKIKAKVCLETLKKDGGQPLEKCKPTKP